MTRRRSAPERRGLALALPLLLAAWAAGAAPAPSVLLFGASLTAARDFSVAAAQARGWRVLAVDAARATFEQTLDEAPAQTDADPEGPPARTIRVFADFSEESAGTRVSLHAQEWESPGTGGEWMSDVTEAYGENLANALATLRAKWDAGAGPPAVQSQGGVGASPGALTGAGAAHYRPVGTWAYYAESYAQQRGCEPTDAGAALESAGQDFEVHRVECRDGHRLQVRCSHGDCTAAP